MRPRWLRWFMLYNLWLALSGKVGAQNRLRCTELPPLPAVAGKPNPGVAGAFAGLSHDALLVAGGANFPTGYPWQSGAKVWHPTVYVLTRRATGYGWQTAQPLAYPLGYGASAVWRDRLIGVGGNDDQRRYAEVFTLEWNPTSRQVRADTLPALPLALANASAAVLADVLYVFGGESDGGTERSLYALDLNHPASGWQKRSELPGPPRAFTALVAHHNALYVLGGRQTLHGKTTVFRDVYTYQPRLNSWSAGPELPTPLAAHGAAANESGLFVFGGDDGVRLGQIEQLTNRLNLLPDGPEKAALIGRRNTLQSDHPGFRREVWQLRPHSRTWTVVGTLPFAAPVTTAVVRWRDEFILPSGEVSPGVRTPACRQITLKNAGQ